MFYSEKIQDLTAQVENLCDELDNTKLKANEDGRKFKRTIEDKVSTVFFAELQFFKD